MLNLRAVARAAARADSVSPARKHTNFHLSTHAPMMLRIPGVTDQNKPYGIRTLVKSTHTALRGCLPLRVSCC